MDCVNSSGSVDTRLAFQWEQLSRLNLAHNVLDGFHDSLVRSPANEQPRRRRLAGRCDAAN